jgi:hypothetical protein
MTNVATISAIRICNIDDICDENCKDIKPRITAIIYAVRTVKSPLVFVVIDK